MWTDENRARYDRSKLRYPSDLTDEEWALIGPSDPAGQAGGNKRTVDVREVVNGVMYILSTGCQWAALPKDLPPRSTVNDYFRRWDDDGTLDRIHHALYVQCREMAGRRGQPDRRRSSTARASRARKKGALDRPAGLRCWQEDQRQEAPSPGRYAGPADARHRACCRHAGSRWRRAADEHAVRPVPVPAEALRRQRLPGHRSSSRAWPALPARSTSRSSSAPMPASSSCCPSAGSSSEPSPG